MFPYFYPPARRRGKLRTELEVIQNSGQAKYIRTAKTPLYNQFEQIFGTKNANEGKRLSTSQ